MNSHTLSIVIPAYNEEARIGSTLDQLLCYLESRGGPFELLVVDDGSSDRTLEIVQSFASQAELPGPIRVYRNKTNRGKGYSVRRGMLEAQGDFVLFTDADLSTPIEELPKLEREVFCGGDIAFGSRDVEGSDIQIHQPWWRESSGKIFNRLVRYLMGLPYHDTQCGFKLFRMGRCAHLFKRQTIFDFGFDVELLYVARKWGLVMTEVPVVWRHSIGSKVQVVPHGLGMLRDLIRIRINDCRGRYNPQRQESESSTANFED